MDGLQERGVLVRGGTALGGEGALRVTYGTAGGERTLPGGACRGARPEGPGATTTLAARDDHAEFRISANRTYNGSDR